MRLAVFTVADNQHVPQARTLLDTVARFLPDAQRFLVLADEPHPLVTYPAGCEVVPACALDIPDFLGFAFRYDPVEFAAALKPFAFLHLLRTRSCTHCVYLDPDVELFSPLPAVMEALAADAPFVLTPHVLAPAEDADGPGDVTFMRDGAFNLGFLGVSATPAALDLLAWWSRWTRRNGVNDRPIGLYLDQRFIDLVPGFASGVRILHDPTLNVAHWNLSQRAFVPDAPGGPRVDGRALGFFHYSGFDPADPGRLSTEGEGWRDRALPEAWCRFLASYAARLQAAGHGTVPGGLYAFGRFVSGVPIPGIARRMFRDDHEAWAGDPFATYESWCHLPAREAVPGIGSAIPSLITRWLQARHPALTGLNLQDAGGAEAATRWWLEQGSSIGIDPRFIQPLALSAGLRPIRFGAHRPAPGPDRADATVVAPLADAGPAGQAGRAISASLSDAAGRVECLDVLAAGVGAASGRVLALCLAPGQLRPFFHVLRSRLPSAAYRIFVPSGELVDLSPPVLQALEEVDEVWAPTRFLQARMVLATALPVLHMPLPWEMPPSPDALSPSGRPYVLAACDGFAGCGELLAAVQAYRAAFGDTPPVRRPRLVVPRSKMAEWDPVLRDAIAGTEGVEVSATSEVAPLVAGAACVLALHRGEALGLTVVRALAWGVPVVATDAGGCTDLLTPDTGFPVDARLAPAQDGLSPIAHADPSHAAWSLREVFDRPDEAARRVAQARRALAAAPGPACARSRLAALGLVRERAEAAA